MKKNNNKIGIFVRLFLTSTTIFFLIMILLLPYAKNRLKEKCRESVIGTCIEVTSIQKEAVVKKTNHKGHHKNKITKSYVEYTSHIVYKVDGVEYKTTKVSKNKLSLKEGEQIEIFYDPNNPNTCYIP